MHIYTYIFTFVVCCFIVYVFECLSLFVIYTYIYREGDLFIFDILLLPLGAYAVVLLGPIGPLGLSPKKGRGDSLDRPAAHRRTR